MAGTIAFTGGSLTAGVGWLPEEFDQLWVNLVHKGVPKFQNLTCINAAVSGASNTEIFADSVRIISNISDLEYLVCSWVTLLRYNFSIGLETYDTRQPFHHGFDTAKDHNLNTGAVSKAYIDNIKNRFFALHHDHYEICKLVKYINAINNLCNKLGIKVYHVNDSLPWDQDYFKKLEGADVFPEDYTLYTKTEILNINNRKDEEIQALYNKIHNEYAILGGIQDNSWINLYKSLEDSKFDYNNDNYHPGTQSNLLYFQTIKTFIENQQ